MIRVFLCWGLLAMAVAAPLIAAAHSPLLAWRDPVYIVAGFAGVVAMTLLLVQPLLAMRMLPGPSPATSRRWHRGAGRALVVMTLVHVAGLWATSPPDVIDALLWRSPTPFAAWGVIAMWAVFAAAALAAARRWVRLDPRVWRRMHVALALTVLGGTVTHALLIEGTMEVFTKTVLCALIAAAALPVAVGRRVRGSRPRG